MKREVVIPRRSHASDEAIASGHRPFERRDEEEDLAALSMSDLGPVRQPMRPHQMADHLRTDGPNLKVP